MNEESEDGEGKRVLTINIKSEFAQVGKAPTIQQEDFESHGKGFRHSEQATADGEASILVVSHKRKKKATSSDKVDDESDNSVQEYWQRERNNRSKKRNDKKKNHHPKKEIVKPFHNQSLGPASPSKSSREFFKISSEIMKELQEERDQGQWKKFYELVETRLREFANNDEVKTIILLEKGQAACYNNRPDSEEILENARNMANMASPVNSSYLVARAEYYLSALYRRQKKFGKAIDCVILASQNLHHTELVLDTAMLTYERASAWMDFILHCDKPDAKLIESVTEELRKVIDQIFALKENPPYQCYFKTHRYALIKIAMLLLDCRTTNGRRRSVNEANIKEAKRSLDVIKNEYWEQITQGERIQFFLAQADLHFRMIKYEEAEKNASDALREAKKFEFNTEIKLAKDRLDDITQSRALAKADGSHGNSVSTKHASGSHGNIAPVVEEAMPDSDHGKSSDGMSSEVYNGGESSSPGSDSFDSP